MHSFMFSSHCGVFCVHIALSAIQPLRYPMVQMDCSSHFPSLPSAQLGVPLIAQPNVVTASG